MLDIDISERHHRHVIGSGIGYADGKSLRERDGLAIRVRRREYALAEFEPFDQVVPFFFRRLEIAVLGVGKNEIQSKKLRFDVVEFVLSAVAEMGLANRFINPAGAQMIYETSARISLGRGMAETKQLFDETGVPFSALSVCKIEELPHRKVAGMRCHKVEKTGLGFGITESAKTDELGFVDAHGL